MSKVGAIQRDLYRDLGDHRRDLGEIIFQALVSAGFFYIPHNDDTNKFH